LGAAIEVIPERRMRARAAGLAGGAGTAAGVCATSRRVNIGVAIGRNTAECSSWRASHCSANT
jgi:hypothetical protein